MNFRSSGWRKDLKHILKVYYKYNVDHFTESDWFRVKERFFDHFLQHKKEALEVKEARPLDFMAYIFIETNWWYFWMSSLTWENPGSPGRRFRMLSMSANRTSLEASSSECRADKHLVRSSHRIVCSLANSAIRVQTATCSISLMLPISCIIWRWRA